MYFSLESPEFLKKWTDYSSAHVIFLFLTPAIDANAKRSYPFSVIYACPFWKAFSITMPTPTISACACAIKFSVPLNASPFAKKSSMNNTLSPFFNTNWICLILCEREDFRKSRIDHCAWLCFLDENQWHI